MAFTLTQVAVTTTATDLVTLQPGARVTLLASAATEVGTSDAVTSGTGFTLPANVPVPFTVPDEEGQSAVTLYGITGSTSNVSIAVAD